MRAPKQSNGGFVPLPSAEILVLGENLSPPIAAIGRFLAKLPAKPDVSSQVRDIVNGDEHIDYGVHLLHRTGSRRWLPVRGKIQDRADAAAPSARRNDLFPITDRSSGELLLSNGQWLIDEFEELFDGVHVRAQLDIEYRIGSFICRGLDS